MSMSEPTVLGCARIITRAEWGPDLGITKGEGSVREILGQRTGASSRSLYWIELAPGSSTIMLKHPDESVYYVASGAVRVETSGGAPLSLVEGAMFHVRPDTDYTIVADTAAELVGGPAPVDPDFGQTIDEQSTSRPIDTPREVRKFHRDEACLQVPFISRDARLIVWYGASAVNANMNYVVLEPGERNAEHLHRYSEDTIFILEGHGTAEDVTNGQKLAFGPGDVVHIPPAVIHAVAADQGQRVVSVGGPCPADLDMLRAAGVDVEAISIEFGLTTDLG
jgi:quercetin dioxygenase-like cupin family protein